MGRVKIRLKRLENNACRQTTFSKRKNGLVKKANELSILCDIDIVLLMFSPSGKPTLFNGQKSSMEDLMLKFAQLTPQERAKRKLESLEVLKRAFKKLDHDVNIREFFGPSYQSTEDVTNQVNVLRTRLLEVQEKLSYWSNLDKIHSIEYLGQMEHSLKESLNQIRTHKENLVQQQELGIQCVNELENGMHIPLGLGNEQQVQPLSWIPNDYSQRVTLPDDLNLLRQRDTDCFAGAPFENSSGYLGVSGKMDISKVGQENSTLGELSRTGSLRLQLYEQYLRQSHDFNFLDDKTSHPPAPFNMHENINGNFEFPESGYDLSHRDWASTSGTCAFATIDEHLFQQPHYSFEDCVDTDLDHM